MGTLTLTVAKSTDTTGGLSYKVNIADGDIDRLSAAYAANYFPAGVEDKPAVTNADGSVTPATMRAPTADEVVTAIANGLAQGMLANTVSYERQKAAHDAAAGIAPMTVTRA